MKKSKFARIVSAFLAIAMTVCFLVPDRLSLSITASAVTGDAKEDRKNEGTKNASDDVDFWNDINIDQSFAYQVRMATNYANRQYSAGNSIGEGTYDSLLTMSNIAPFYGYSEGEIETDYLTSPENIRSNGTNSSVSATIYSRELFSMADDIDSYAYYSYGLLLSLIGFDSVGTDATDVTREAFGWIALGSYHAASWVNLIFEVTFDFLYATNPFMFFKDITTSSSAGQDELNTIYDDATGSWGSGANTDGSVGALAEFFGKIYDVFTSFAWSVSIPLALLFIVISFFLTRRGRYSFASNMKKVLVKVVFLAIGIPILGSAYTQVLTALKDSQAMSDEFLTQAVSYTFLDFGRWVETARLQPPVAQTLSLITSSADKKTVDATVVASTWGDLREICSQLNRDNGVFVFNDQYIIADDRTGTLLKDYVYDTSSTSPSLSINATTHGTTKYDNRQAVSTLLKKYRDGTKYHADTFASNTIAWMQNNPSGGTAYGDMISLSCDKYSFSQKAERQIHGLQGKINAGSIQYDPQKPKEASAYSTVALARFSSSDFAGVGYNVWNNGTICGDLSHPDGSATGSGHTGNPLGIQYYGDEGFKKNMNEGYDCKKRIGFSTMSMYTYLTSEFTQTGVIAYGNAPSVYTQNAHYAVNLIGSDFFMQFAFFSNTIALLLGYFVLAVAFVFRTGFDILFKGFQLMGHALLAAAGLYKSIGTCICMTVNMIAQLFISVVFFSFMVDLMFILTSVFNNFFYNVFDALTTGIALKTSSLDATSSYAVEVLVICSTLVSTFVIVFFISFAIKWRSLIMTSINSMVETVVGTLLGVQLTGASDGVAGNMARAAFNDAVGVAGAAAVAAGGVKLADEAKDMVADLKTDAQETFGDNADDNISAEDAAVNPTVGAAFDGGKGSLDSDPNDKADGEDALENGLGPKEKIAGEMAAADNEKTGSSDVSNETQTDENVTANQTEDGILVRDGSGQNATENAAEKTDDADEDAENELEFGINGFVGHRASKSKTSNMSSANTSSEKNKSDSSEKQTADAVANETQNSDNPIQTEELETENGTEWSQTNTDTGATSGIKFDPTRGLVMSSVDENGVVSDVAVGLNGLSVGSTDEDGNRTISTINSNGMQTSYTGADGTTETTTTSFDGLNSNVHVERTDANGNSEEITTGLDGTTVKRSETLADGSTKETVSNADGTKSITMHNAETGYESVEEIANDGSSEKTETVNGVTTTSHTNADGVLTAQEITSVGANGVENTSSYSLKDDGTVVTRVSASGTITETVMTADGAKTETQSTVLNNGSVVETTMSYDADGNAASDAKTVVRSADGKNVLYEGSTATGTDSVGSYSLSSASTAAGSLEVKDYGGGHVVSTETMLNGSTCVTEAADGGYTVTENNSATGETRVTSIDKNGNGQTVIRDSSGQTVDTVSLTKGSDGSVSYINMAGGSVSMATVGEGNDAERVMTQSYATGGQRIGSENIATGIRSVTVTDGIGSENVTTYDSKSGSTTISSVHANGSATESVLDANGNYREVVSTGNGGQTVTVRSGSGEDVVEQVTMTDGAGNKSVTVTRGGQTTYVEGASMSGASFVQEVMSDGALHTTQTLDSGDVVSSVVYSNGDYDQTTRYASGAERVETVTGSRTEIRTTSATGIETAVLREGSATTSTVKYSGIKMSEVSDTVTGSYSKKFEVPSGQTYEIVTEADGGTKTVFEMPNGSYGSFRTNTDGSSVHIIRQADKSSRIETITSAGESTVVYMDAMGNTVNDASVITRLNDAYVQPLTDFNTGMQSANEYIASMSAVPEFANISDIGRTQVSHPTNSFSFPGMMMSASRRKSAFKPVSEASNDFNESLLAAQLNGPVRLDLSEGGSMEDFETRRGGSTTGNTSE